MAACSICWPMEAANGWLALFQKNHYCQWGALPIR